MGSFKGLGPGLVELRRQRGKKAGEIAQRAGITKGMLSSYENDRVEPSLGSLGKVLDALGAGPGDLERAMHRARGSKVPALEGLIGTGDFGPAERALLADRLEGLLEVLLRVVVPALRGPELQPEPKGKKRK